jgi:hypothetical protein
MAIPGIQEIQALATKYSKPQLQKMAQMGLIDPTKAVMAGMMIDRIQQQNMQPPQQTVAEEVMGAPPPPPMAGGAPEGAPPPGGIAGLPSNLPPQMAGGGIVAFAEGGDTEDYADGGAVRFDKGNLVQSDPGIIKYVDPNWESSKSFKRNYTNDDKFALLAEQLAHLTAAERQAQGVDKIRIQKDIAQLQSTMRSIKASPAARSLVDQIPLPGAGAAEPPRSVAPSAAKTSTLPDEPVYTPEGVLLSGEAPTEAAVRKAPPGQPYEPSLIRDILEGRPNVQIATPRKEEKKAEPAPAPAPAPKPADKEVAKVEKAEMGPARPSAEQRLENQLAGLSGKTGKELTPDEVLDEQDKMFARLGVNKDFFTNLRRDYESTRGKFTDRAEKAAGHAMMMFGAGLMGARQGEFFSTASKAAQQSLMMYMSSMDKISEQEEKLNKDLRDLNASEEQYKRSRATSALEAVQKNREKIADRQVQIADMEIKGLGFLTNAAVEDFRTRNPTKYMEAKRISEDTGKPIEEVIKMLNFGGAGSAGSLADKAYDNVMRRAQVDLSFQMKINQDPQALQDAINAETRRLQSGGAAPAAGGGGVGGKVDTSNPLLRQ